MTENLSTHTILSAVADAYLPFTAMIASQCEGVPIEKVRARLHELAEEGLLSKSAVPSGILWGITSAGATVFRQACAK